MAKTELGEKKLSSQDLTTWRKSIHGMTRFYGESEEERCVSSHAAPYQGSERCLERTSGHSCEAGLRSGPLRGLDHAASRKPLPHRHLRPLTRPPRLLLTRAGRPGPSPRLRKACVSEPLRNFTKLLGSDSVVWSGLLGSSLKTSPGGAHIGGGNYCPE